MARHTEETRNVDINTGKRIYDLRIASGLSRKDVALKIGVTHQQLQKYEKGINRISSGRLKSIAEAFNRPISYFFEEKGNFEESLHGRMCMELARNFMKLSATNQDAVNSLVRRLVTGEQRLRAS